MERILLHTCCAPCSGAIIEWMLQNGYTPTIYYCNPNIYPYEEYMVRKEECSRYALSLGLDIIDADYDHSAWQCCIAGKENEPERGARCLECFRYRLCRAAAYAHSHGFHVLTTTLASSRWKDLNQVNLAGEEACAPYEDVLWWPQNWRKGGLQERRGEIIKEMDFYNQLYCGCEFSWSHKHDSEAEMNNFSK